MEKKKSIFDNTIVSLVLLVLAFIVGMVVFGGISGAIRAITTGDPMATTEVGQALDSFIVSVGGAVVSVFVAKKMYKDEYTTGLGSEGLSDGFKYMATLFIVAVVAFIISLLSGSFFVTGDKLIAAFLTAATAGIFEELVFRSGFCGLLMRKGHKDAKGVWIAVIVSALVFGAVHAGNSAMTGGEMTSVIIWQIFQAIAVGLLFGAAFVRSKNVWGCITSHFIFDLAIMILMKDEMAIMYTSDMSILDTIETIAIAIVCLGAALYLLRPAKMQEAIEKWSVKEA
ncbi:MAG: CPBP family intramembrane metalloprotease [Erysipelotrichaceae bacterium]|nr:CPBP family intramembrane metalloprotease [Erysipelotrichaceae bacterium]